MRVLLLEPYFSGSHAQWAEGYRSGSRHDVSLVTHEGQFWKWRLGGGFVTLADQVRDHIRKHGRPDVVLATSMLNFAGFLGLMRRELGDVPAALYLHENQVTYPQVGRTRVETQHGLVTWSSLLAADAIAFNSAFHRDVLFETLPTFLGSFPDRRHSHLVAGLADRVSVLPVGIDLRRFDPVVSNPEGPPLILWNHRWDPDKDPGLFLDAAADLATEGFDFSIALTGERFAFQQQEWDEPIARLGDRVVVAEHLDPESYRDVVRRSDIAVSTALQEFFGVSVTEAMYTGAFPLLPNRLVYPERVPVEFHERCLYSGRAQLTEGLRWALEHLAEARQIGARLREDSARYDWSVVAPSYDDWLEELVDA